MQKFSTYKKNKIAHFHKDNGFSAITTIKKFSITYKELYKIIDTSRIFNFVVKNGVKYKKCGSCSTYKEANWEYFYGRKGTNYLQSNCKYCMKQLSKNYAIINKKKIYQKNKAYYKEYYLNNKTEILARGKKYYKQNQKRILSRKRNYYKGELRKSIKKFLLSLNKANYVAKGLYKWTNRVRSRNRGLRDTKLTNPWSNENISRRRTRT